MCFVLLPCWTVLVLCWDADAVLAGGRSQVQTYLMPTRVNPEAAVVFPAILKGPPQAHCGKGLCVNERGVLMRDNLGGRAKKAGDLTQPCAVHMHAHNHRAMPPGDLARPRPRQLV